MPRPQLAEFMRRMEPNSVAILPAAREVARSNDTEYRFRQDSDFYYLTGFKEPDAVAVVAPGREARFTLFVRPRDKEKETWTGRRAGVEGAREAFGADEAFPIEELQEKLAELLDGARNLYYRLGNGNPELDQTVIRQIARMRGLGWRKVRPPQIITDPGTLLHEMRLIKTEAEIALMQRAADIASDAHREAMRAARAGVKEYEIEALIEYIFRKNGAAAPAYNSIVGSGANATILHYVNNDAELKDGDLLLIDAGAEYECFASDITRTFPVSGRFTGAQRDIYQLVLDCQERCIEMIAPGVTLDEMHRRSVEILTEGMVRLGLLKGEVSKLIEEEQYKKFYMHRLGHYLGMDVH
ncbi:MAG: Xaa-Pro aminopeptidase, partial [Acidobacteriota bacterium]|nr:Xaa-Pro aminopeptidase [Acidobacteriota bacterium]